MDCAEALDLSPSTVHFHFHSLRLDSINFRQPVTLEGNLGKREGRGEYWRLNLLATPLSGLESPLPAPDPQTAAIDFLEAP